MRPKYDPLRGKLIAATDLRARKPLTFDLAPDARTMSLISAELGCIAIRKLRFHGALQPDGPTDWHLTASLGATALQPCVVTLEPVTTRIDEIVERRFVAVMPEMEKTGSHEFELLDDMTIEPLPGEIDLTAMMTEALALALPDYPRSPDVVLKNDMPDANTLPEQDEERPNPFAALADLRDKFKRDS